MLRHLSWSAVSSYSGIIVNFVVFLLLSRLLTPAEFGVVSIASIMIDIAIVIAKGGISEAVVQSHDTTSEYYNSAFVVSLISGLLLCGVIVTTAPLVSHLFSQPVLSPMLMVLSITCVFSGGAAVHEGRLIKAFGFKQIAGRTFFVNVVSGAVGVGMASAGYGAWSLIIQRLISVVAIAIVTWIAFPWRPALKIERRLMFRQIEIGSSILGTNLLLLLNTRIHELITALFLPIAAVGYLRLAWRCVDLLSQLTLTPLVAVALPAYAKAVSTGHPVGDVYVKFLSLAAWVALPAFALFAIVAPAIVPLTFGHQWSPGVPVVQLLMCLSPALIANSLMWPLFMSTGRAKAGLVVAAVAVATGSVLTLLTAQFGLVIVALTHVIRAYATWPLGGYVLQRLRLVGYRHTLLVLAKPCASVALAALAVALIGPGIAVQGHPSWDVVMIVATFVGCYAASAIVMESGVRAGVSTALLRVRGRVVTSGWRQ